MSKVAVTKAQAARQAADDTSYFGFWVYLMTDCVLFASLFAVYAVLRGNNFGGPTERQLFSLPYVLTETLILLTSSYCCGLATLALRRRNVQAMVSWLFATMGLGMSFLALEIHEFHHLASIGDSWHRSGSLSAYFTLVGTHGLHITVGLLWLVVLLFYTRKRGLTAAMTRKLRLFSIFWHFLDVIWIFIFSIVYLFGVLQP